MYRNTMYIPTITSWLHSQWQSYIAIKIALWVWISQQFSSRRRTSNKNNTEYRTSVQKITLLHQNKENSEKKQTQKQFFTVTVRDESRDNYWNPKFETINLIWFWTFFLWELMLPKLQTLHCNGILILNNHSNRSLTKV